MFCLDGSSGRFKMATNGSWQGRRVRPERDKEQKVNKRASSTLAMSQGGATPGKRSSSRSAPAQPQFPEDQSPVSNGENHREEGSPLPGINERLGYLRPSRELLEYYRKKIAEYDGEHEEMAKKLEQYKMTYEEQHVIQWELRQREEEIAELQKALSDMQVFLFQEREHVLRLYAENDRLKIRELEDRKKIQTLLSLCGMTESEVSYFLKEPPNKAVVEQKLPAKLRADAKPVPRPTRAAALKRPAAPRSSSWHSGGGGGLSPTEEEKYSKDNQTLTLQVEALQAQLEEQTKLAKEQMEALLEDRRVKVEEMETRRVRDTDKIKALTEKLKKTQDLLYDGTKDFLDQRYEGRSMERNWMAEKDRLLSSLDVAKSQLNISRDNILQVSNVAPEAQKRNSAEIEALEYQLQQAQKLADMYREQVIQLEDERARIREEGEIGQELFKERSDKMSKRLNLMNQRYQDLERRRNLEVEGFKNDIKILRVKLKDVEKQLFKVTVDFGDNLNEKRPDDLDMQILRNVRRTAGRSKKLMGDLKNIKSKVYGLENDLRHL